jgi:subtilase family serine protease
MLSSLPPLARLKATSQMKLSIHLPLRNAAALTSFVDQLYDPASQSYHHYLTPDEFDARFGPTAADYQTLLDFATRHGFVITAQHPNRLLLEVSAAVGDIESAFQVKLNTYQHPTEPRTFFAPDTEPSVEAGIPISYIGGLDNFARPHPQNLHRSPLNPTTKALALPQIIGSGPNGNLAGFDYRAVYAPGVSLTGTGQSVGLVEFDGFYPGDITSYENQTGLTNVPLQIVTLDGFNGVPTTGANSGNGEVALDIEMAISMAPGLSNVVVYEDDPNLGQFNNVLHAMSANAAIKQFSCSWSFSSITTAQRTNMDGYFLKFAAQGQSFFAASGDSGAATGAIGAPDDDPYITLVGGTTLATAGSGGAWVSETVWNTQQGAGNFISSGGISTIYNIPPWQQGVNMAANHGSTTKRNAPDVAMVADNIFLVADNGVQQNSGGTSAAAPLWAGFAALVNEQAVTLGQSTIGFVNPALYHLGTNASFNACFDDITVGNNTNTSTTLFLAVPGYDLCTGFGSPAGSSLIIALTQPDGFQITPARGFVASGPVGGPFTVSSQALSLTNAGKPAFNWSLGTTSAWLNVSTDQGGLTSSAGTANVTVSLNSAANQLPAGIHTANVWFTNLTSGLAQLRQFSLMVGQELVRDGGFEAGDFCYWNLIGSDANVYNSNIVDNGTTTGYWPYTGVYFAALGQVSNLAYLTQPLSTHVGQFYLLSLWLANEAGATPNQFQVQWNPNATTSNIIFNQVNLGTFDYSNLVFVVQATANLTALKLGFRNDNGVFSLDNVSVVPVPTPTIQTAAVVNHALQLGWNALPGLNYQVQYKTNLLQSSWIDLSTVITATGNHMMFTDSLASLHSRFYRLEFVP